MLLAHVAPASLITEPSLLEKQAFVDPFESVSCSYLQGKDLVDISDAGTGERLPFPRKIPETKSKTALTVAAKPIPRLEEGQLMESGYGNRVNGKNKRRERREGCPNIHTRLSKQVRRCDIHW